MPPAPTPPRSYLARRVPYVWDNARGSTSLGDAALQLNRFLQARTAAGQASQVDTELDALAADVKDKTLESMDVKLFVEQADPKLDAYVAAKLQRAGIKVPVKASSVGITDPVTVFDDTMQVPWEVDEFWQRFKSDVLPKVKSGSKVDLEARLSESPDIRRGLVEQARTQLQAAGATEAKVRVLSAYKQGYLWMTEQVIPELKGKNARAVKVKVAEYHPDLSKKYKFYMVPSRWVHELYPVDEMFQRDLGIAKDAFTVELVDNPKDTYTVEATDAAGKVIFHTAFTPKTVEREYLDKFPGWSRVIVTTGWLSASIDGTSVVDRRIATDPERFWDHYQSNVLPRIYDNVMKVTEQSSAARQAAVPSRPRHRSLDERTRFQDWRRRRAGVVARSAARGPLFRDARFLRRARPHDHASAGWRRPERSFRSFIPIARASRARSRCTTRETRRRSRRSRSPTRRRASSGRRVSRATS